MNRVAITGFGVVSPIGTGAEQFWDSVRNGRSGVDRITHFDCSTFAVQLAGEVKQLPPLPDTLARVAHEDRKVGLAFAAAREALSMAGIDALDARTWLHIGTSLEVFDLSKAVWNGKPDFHSIVRRSLDGELDHIKVPLDTTAQLIAETFGRPGRMLTNCSACAASAQAIGHGFRSIRSGRCERALCGGFDSMLNPLGVGGFQLLGALTTDNDRGASACRPFDASRSGTVLGEGAAMLVLEDLDRTRAAGRRILAEVCGYASSLDAHNLSAPDPEGDGAARAMLGALDDARIPPAEVSYINAHGTGTRLNDEVEARAIRRVFKGTWERTPVSSLKAMTGHLIAAAGAAEAGACILALTQDILPPNPHLETPASGCELDLVGVEAAPFGGEYVLSNSFGFGGQNAALVFRRSHAGN